MPLQSPNPVLELEYLRPVNSNGRKLDRSVLLHFLSMGEFVDALMQDDFELGVSVFYAGYRRKQFFLCLLRRGTSNRSAVRTCE